MWRPPCVSRGYKHAPMFLNVRGVARESHPSEESRRHCARRRARRACGNEEGGLLYDYVLFDYVCVLYGHASVCVGSFGERAAHPQRVVEHLGVPNRRVGGDLGEDQSAVHLEAEIIFSTSSFTTSGTSEYNSKFSLIFCI